MSHPIGRRRRRGLSFRGILVLVGLGIILGIGTVIYFSDNALDNSAEDADSDDASVALTPSPVVTAPPEIGATINRRIYFPNAETAGLVVEAYRMPGGWDVSHLQDLVGHLEGTPWLGQEGNIVLAGHFEDELGRPGPFRYLYFAEIGDRILLQDGTDTTLHVYEVREVFRTDPNDVEVLRKTDTSRLTLITCDAWSYDTKTYQERLVVVAEPIGTTDEAPPVTQVSQ